MATDAEEEFERLATSDEDAGELRQISVSDRVSESDLEKTETPTESMDRLRKALGFDVVFNEEFKILRPYLGRMSRNWPRQIQETLFEQDHLKQSFGSADAIELDHLMDSYIMQMRTGRFYEGFFESVQNLAEFFIKNGVPNSWLVGAFMRVFHEAQLEVFFDKEARHGRVVVAALRCLLKILTLTTQILNGASFTQLGRQVNSLAPY